MPRAGRGALLGGKRICVGPIGRGKRVLMLSIRCGRERQRSRLQQTNAAANYDGSQQDWPQTEDVALTHCIPPSKIDAAIRSQAQFVATNQQL
jgi:hypothetical protein